MKAMQAAGFIGMLLGVGGLENPVTQETNMTAVIVLLISIMILGCSFAWELCRDQIRAFRRNMMLSFPFAV